MKLKITELFRSPYGVAHENYMLRADHAYFVENSHACLSRTFHDEHRLFRSIASGEVVNNDDVLKDYELGSSLDACNNINDYMASVHAITRATIV